MTIQLTVNNQPRTVTASETTPLLDVLRNELGLKGTRYGCGLEQCGSCMVLVDGEPVYACSREIGTVAGRGIITIEGLGSYFPGYVNDHAPDGTLLASAAQRNRTVILTW